MSKINIKQAVILAGGQGIRLRPLTYKIPKPMVRINKRPFLEHLMIMLRENGIQEIVLLLGYLPEKITHFFGNGEKLGLRITYSHGETVWDTGTRIKKAEKLLDDYFLLMYCDNYWPLNLKKLVSFYNQDKTLGTVTVYSNKDRITQNNMTVDQKGYVLKYDRSRTEKNLNGVEIGFFIMDKKVLTFMPGQDFSFEADTLPQLIRKKQLRGFLTDYRYYSIGNLEKLFLTRKFLKPKKIIFLDRDGVINKKPAKSDYVKNWQEFKFLPGVVEALKLLTQKKYLIFIISNQAGIARGLTSKKDVENIHQKMKKELRKEGVKIKNIYFCPHGWREGCDCRKPEPGMFFQAAREHYLNLSKAVFIGDDQSDLQAGKAAGCQTILVRPQKNLLRITKTLLKN